VILISPGFVDTEMVRRLRLVPKIPAERVAQAVADALDRPQREVFVPGYYRLAAWLEAAAPSVIDLALWWRGR